MDLLLADLQRRLADHDLTLELTPAARRLIAAEGHDPAFGARPLKRAVQRLVENPLARALLEGRFAPGLAHHGRRGSLCGTLLFKSGDETVVATAGERRDARARSTTPASPTDPVEAAIERASRPRKKPDDGGELLN